MLINFSLYSSQNGLQLGSNFVELRRVVLTQTADEVLDAEVSLLDRGRGAAFAAVWADSAECLLSDSLGRGASAGVDRLDAADERVDGLGVL